MSKAQGLSSPGAPSAPLSPVLNPSLGAHVFATVRLRILTKSPVFFLFRNSLLFVRLSLPLTLTGQNRPGNSRRRRFASRHNP